MKAIGCSKLSEVGDEFFNYDVIAIDEGQFFPDVISNWALILPFRS